MCVVRVCVCACVRGCVGAWVRGCVGACLCILVCVLFWSKTCCKVIDYGIIYFIYWGPPHVISLIGLNNKKSSLTKSTENLLQYTKDIQKTKFMGR